MKILQIWWDLVRICNEKKLDMPRDHGFYMNQWIPSLFPVNEKHDSVTKEV